MTQRPKHPKDADHLAKRIVDIATGSQAEDIATQPEGGKDPAAVTLGLRGGLKGGAARTKSLSPSERQQIAQKAALARWRVNKNEPGC